MNDELLRKIMNCRVGLEFTSDDDFGVNASIKEMICEKGAASIGVEAYREKRFDLKKNKYPLLSDRTSNITMTCYILNQKLIDEIIKALEK